LRQIGRDVFKGCAVSPVLPKKGCLIAWWVGFEARKIDFWLLLDQVSRLLIQNWQTLKISKQSDDRFPALSVWWD
jgi:hypothetical protein